MYQKLIAFRDEQGVSLEQIFSDQVADMQNWGRGRFWRYFITSIGLNIDEIAFANIAWCATAGNNYPIQMLSQCYEKFTSRLLEALSPDVILLSGSNVHSFSNRVQTILPNAKLFPILHYAHREGMQLEKREVKRIQELLRTVSG
jgi:hypothetical protein